MRRMLKLGVAVALAGAVLGVGALESHAKGKPAPNPSTTPAVRVTFRDLNSDNMQSDEGGPYQDNVDQVVAYISGEGWLIFTSDAFPRKAGVRSIFLEFMGGECLTSCTGDQPFFPSSFGLTRAGVLVKPLTAGAAGIAANGLFGMEIGEERRTLLRVYTNQFDDDWALCFTPDPEDLPGTDVGFCSLSVEGTTALVKRTAQATWEIFAAGPDASGQRSDAASLIKGVGGRNPTATVVGTYSMPFLMTVSCLNEADCPVLPEN